MHNAGPHQIDLFARTHVRQHPLSSPRNFADQNPLVYQSMPVSHNVIELFTTLEVVKATGFHHNTVVLCNLTKEAHSI